MQFLLLIQGDEAEWAKATEAEKKATFSKYMAYSQELQRAGVMRSGEPLRDSSTGARVQVRAGKTRVVDGPFTESKEVLGGFYLVECASKDEAVKWAAKCPGAEYGTMEVREIMVFPKG